MNEDQDEPKWIRMADTSELPFWLHDAIIKPNRRGEIYLRDVDESTIEAIIELLNSMV